MIGVFDSGLGGLTVLRGLVDRFPDQAFIYLGDHARVPYGNRDGNEIVELTQRAVTFLFAAGCRLVILGCNTATAVAARRLQQNWLPNTHWRDQGHNVLGIIAPTVEVATQTPWAVTTPQYPQKYNANNIVVFGTATTIASGVYAEEISKRCPRVVVTQVPCVALAGAIEAGAPDAEIDALVSSGCATALQSSEGRAVDWAILGCTHFPLVEAHFRKHMPPGTRILSQPGAVADSLEDYLARHPHYRDAAIRAASKTARVRLLTTGDPAQVNALSRIFWADAPLFEGCHYA